LSAICSAFCALSINALLGPYGANIYKKVSGTWIKVWSIKPASPDTR